eukprot:CAMPEP_0172694238 /NCGR_PEP_ID=MMETSP1074-20121228/26540_1 /TAXON_ID=2916 /ORGANISM="Ceratium fusus, Strain PA161109" /LENGTH=263 /DNA_ID=CAMNT_0013514725 /DNA_START=17 /DNA_END=808 /DNA_ORIENTATION=+
MATRQRRSGSNLTMSLPVLSMLAVGCLWWTNKALGFTQGNPAKPPTSSVVGQQLQRVQTSGKCREGSLVRMASEEQAEVTNSPPVHAPSLFVKESESSVDDDEPRDFFLFIKDYGWSLRYRVCHLADSVLDVEKPFKLEWVKLRKPISHPLELLNTTRAALFNEEIREPPGHQGFMYEVTRAVGSGVEFVVNFFKGHGLKLFVEPNIGVQVAADDQEASSTGTTAEPKAVTHCWVQVMGLPFLPILQSIAFFNVEECVRDWQA